MAGKKLATYAAGAATAVILALGLAAPAQAGDSNWGSAETQTTAQVDPNWAAPATQQDPNWGFAPAEPAKDPNW